MINHLSLCVVQSPLGHLQILRVYYLDGLRGYFQFSNLPVTKVRSLQWQIILKKWYLAKLSGESNQEFKASSQWDLRCCNESFGQSTGLYKMRWKNIQALYAYKGTKCQTVIVQAAVCYFVGEK